MNVVPMHSAMYFDILRLSSKGRCAVAHQDIPCGTLVLSSEPMAAVLDETSEMFNTRSIAVRHVRPVPTFSEIDVHRPLL